MRSFIAVLIMAVWTAVFGFAMNAIGFQHHLHDLWWSLGAAVMLLIGLIGNVWIYFLVAKETPWEWVKKDS